MKKLDLTSSKKGAASLYVVIFTTILFSVITLSFVRIILSETNQSRNDDLSRSAYDSALAGVEDAKIAVNQYYQCLNAKRTDCTKYGGIGAAANPTTLFGGDCNDFLLEKVLYSGTGEEVKIQESTSGGEKYKNNTEQAYTCVIINNVVPDYRSTLTSDTHTRVVPLGIGSTDLDKVKRVEFRWYSEINGTDFKNVFPADANESKVLQDITQTTTPPVVSLTLLQTGSSIDLDSFNTAETSDYSTMILKPVSEGGSNKISIGEIRAAGLASHNNSLFQINCGSGEFACTVNLETEFTSGGNAFLIVSLPYGDTVTDFAVTLYDSDSGGNVIDFENVQISVDSTGRANQLLRRVETRLDPSDTFFPYPEYEVTLGGDSEDSFSKYFWITYNCWTEKGYCRDSEGNIINNGSM